MTAIIACSRGPGAHSSSASLPCSPAPAPTGWAATAASTSVLPSPVSLVFTGEPATERVHKMGIEPNGERWGHYEIAGDALTTKGTYTATIKLISQPAPVNLLLAIQDVGFDYGLTPVQARDALVQGAQVLWEEELKFEGINQ